MMKKQLVSVVSVFTLLVGAAQAQQWHQMDTAERIRSGMEVNTALIHRLKPVTPARLLPPATESDFTRKLTEEGQSFMRNAVSALVLDNGQLVFELYSQGGAPDAPANAYSMTKSLTSLAVGEALCAGKIKSLDDIAQTYVPALEGTAYGKATLKQLLTYTSGAEDPGGNGFIGIHNRLNYNAMVTHKRSLVSLIKAHGDTSRFKPGEKFFYNGLDSQTLSLVVRNATGVPLPAWFESTVWQQAGAESPAAWFVDSEGNGNAEILFFATTRDFARIGQYVLERLTDQAGNDCIRAYLKEASKPLVNKGYWPAAPSWGYALHTGADGNTWMFGANGQRVGINVAKKRVFVTTSNQNSDRTDVVGPGFLAR
jgi:CubicO group peptidase (beta-lactamase class C family)